MTFHILRRINSARPPTTIIIIIIIVLSSDTHSHARADKIIVVHDFVEQKSVLVHFARSVLLYVSSLSRKYHHVDNASSSVRCFPPHPHDGSDNGGELKIFFV